MCLVQVTLSVVYRGTVIDIGMLDFLKLVSRDSGSPNPDLLLVRIIQIAIENYKYQSAFTSRQRQAV